MASSPEGLQVLSTQHFEVESPNNQLVSPDEQIAASKEEEWVTRKKVEVVTKRQIATRVQREVLLEDGKVVQDTGPKVTTTTTEDTQKNESENTEHHDLGDGSTENWVASGDPGVVTEIREKKVTTREQTNETLETEDIKHLGDISDEAYKKAVEGGGNVENWLVRSPGTEVAKSGPRVVGHTSIKRRVTDTEDTLKKKAVDQNGKVVFNTSTVKEHEEVIDDPELNNDKDSGSSKELNFKKTKDQQFVDYVVDGQPAGREMRYDAETTEVVRHGDADWDSLSARLRRNRNKFLKEMEDDRKDALTRRPLDFNQEERVRKVETSKWLDHHFGSESASRSSKESEDEGPHTSFINVTMKSSSKESKPSRVFLSSPEADKPYFKGISEWKSEERRVSKAPRIEGGVQVLPTGPNHSFDSSPSPPYTSSLGNGTKSPSPIHNGLNGHVNGHKSPSPTYNRSKSPSPPLNGISKKFSSTQNLERSSPGTREERFVKTSNFIRHERTTSPFGRASPAYNGHSRSGSTPTNGLSNGKATPTRDYTPPSISPPPRRKHYRHQEKDDEVLEEPAPDYSPTPEPKSRHNTPPPDGKKKVYQRTRFAADIPPPRSGPPKPDKRGGLGESFRKLVGKLVGGKKGGQVDSGTQTRDSNMNGVTTHRYHFGEDPFNSSLYPHSREEYQPHYRSRSKHKSSHEDSRHGSSTNSSTLGRLSKSTSKLSGNERQTQHNGTSTTLYYNDRGGVQTLPRKLQEHKAKKQVYVTRSNGDTSYGDRSNRLGNNSNSMFNVSIVSNTGPAKPARTYRSNLSRSKSFNVHAGDSYRDSNRYTSNPHLSRLDESAELKSPGLITSISRSTRDLTHEDSFRRPLGTYDQNRYAKHNGISSSRTNVDSQKKIFMKGLMERAPELYKTLHANELDENRTVEPVRTSTPLKNGKLEYSTSFSRSSNTSSPLDRVQSPYYNYRNDSPDGVNRSVVRRGSNDYTETVRYTTTSKDPQRPSVTNTVQSFTKKTLPMPGGGEHRIHSTETKTVTKSKFRSGTPELHFDGTSKYPTSNGGVIIEVRNTRK
uniref:Uncharacterized protein n=1 Tax=Lygus hesperus TaxID=30085 RepID=A0A0K8SDI1_LYGHE